MNPLENYYKQLEVAPNASELVIRAAYKSLAQRYHPDKFQGNKEEAEHYMKKVNEAYRILSDEQLRKNYDEKLAQVEKRILENEVYNRATNIVKQEHQKYEENYVKPVVRKERQTKALKIIGAVFAVLLVTGYFTIHTYKLEISNGIAIAKNILPASFNNKNSQANLGFLYQSNTSFFKNMNKSISWYEKAAANDDDEAQYNLGVIYYEGKLQPQDYDKAYNYFLSAAKNGNAYAQYNLSIMYDKGQGTSKNEEQAKYWYKLAHAKLNHE